MDSGGEADRGTLISQNNNVIGASHWRFAQAQSKPHRAPRGNDMMFFSIGIAGQRLEAGWQLDRFDIVGLNYDNIGRAVRRPERWFFSRISFRREREIADPIARPDPPVPPSWFLAHPQCGPSSDRSPLDRWHYGAGIPGRNRRSRDFRIAPRNRASAKTVHLAQPIPHVSGNPLEEDYRGISMNS